MKLLHIYVCCIIVFVVSVKKTRSANVLVMSVAPCDSHTMWDKVLAMGLRDNGHNITFVSHKLQNTQQNFTTILLEGISFYLNVGDHKQVVMKLDDCFIIDIHEALQSFDIKKISGYSATGNIDFLYAWLFASCEHSLHTRGFQKLLKLSKENTKFDLIIMDISAGICFLPIVELFGYPKLIATSPFGLQPYVGDNFGANLHISYIPHYTLRYSREMSFMQRLHNLYVHSYDVWATWMFHRKCKGIMDSVYGKDMSHVVYGIQKNFSFLFVNYDPILDIPRSLLPDVIPLGGLHIKKKKALPQDLQQFMDNSEYGVIIFALGTNVHGVHIGKNNTKLFLQSFSQLKQNVIWKYESNIADLPKNVIIRKYIPQNDLLAHPNVKVFISHGGAMSTQEAISHGVPIIAMPFMIDQYVSTEKIVYRKLGSSLSFKNLTSNYILSTINEVIYNPIYKQNIKLLSDAYRDRPDKPLDRALYWMEYLLRRSSAEVLTSPQRRLSFIQDNLLDLWGFIIGAIVFIYILFTKVSCIITKTRTNKMKSQ